MSNSWTSLLDTLALSKTEREVVKRFEKDPAGRTFLPVSDILRAHKLFDESLELLSEGVARHPQFSVARVVLARELLQKGMVAEAWRTLEDSPVSLRENLLAQKLRFRLAILIGLEPIVKATLQHLKIHQMLDTDGRKIADLFEVSGLDQAREKLIQDLRARGCEPVIPDEQIELSGVSQYSSATTDEVVDEFPGASVLAEASLAGFHVIPLTEIFHPTDGGSGRGAQGGVELDTTTLADIYYRQGHYGKALAVYKRLLKMTPNNDFLRKRVAEVAKLEREQRDTDIQVDPSLVDKMETVEILDRQIKFYNDILQRLS